MYQVSGTWYACLGYVITYANNNIIYFRRDTVGGSSLTAGTERSITQESKTARKNPDVEVLTTGKVMVGFHKRYWNYGSYYTYYWEIWENANNDGAGTWALSVSNSLVSTFVDWGDVLGNILRLTSAKAYTIWASDVASHIKGRYYDGSSWGSGSSIETVVADYGNQRRYGSSAYNDDLAMSYWNSYDKKIYFYYRNNTATPKWRSAETVGWSSQTYETAPQLCTDSSDGNFYVFWVYRQGYNEPIKYNKRTAGTWGISQTFVNNESNPKYTSINCYPEVTNNEIGVCWSAG